MIKAFNTSKEIMIEIQSFDLFALLESFNDFDLIERED
jgi:hypothetical protein